MTTYTVIADGAMEDTSTFSPTGSPGPVDTIRVQGGFTLTENVTRTVKLIECNGGKLVANVDMLFPDVAGAGMIIRAAAGSAFDHNGANGAPRVLRSASADPLNPFHFDIEPVSSGADSRIINMQRLELRGASYRLAVGSHVLYFNEPNAGSIYKGRILTVTPPSRTPSIVSNVVALRVGERLHNNGASSARTTVSGFVPIDDINWWTAQELEDMKIQRARASFVSDIYHLPKCRIEDLRWGKASSLYQPFDLYLAEDV